MNGAEVFAWNADKAYLMDLADHGPVVPTRLIARVGIGISEVGVRAGTGGPRGGRAGHVVIAERFFWRVGHDDASWIGVGPAPIPTATRSSPAVSRLRRGRTCPGEPCEDQPAAGIAVTVSTQLPGEAYVAGPVVARGVSDADGAFRITAAPGAYVVTVQAGMSCELMDVQVSDGEYAEVDVLCDTGIR